MTSPPRGRYRELRVKQLRVIKERQSHRARLQGEGLARQGGAVQPVSDERRAELRELAANLVRAPSEQLDDNLPARAPLMFEWRCGDDVEHTSPSAAVTAVRRLKVVRRRGLQALEVLGTPYRRGRAAKTQRPVPFAPSRRTR